MDPHEAERRRQERFPRFVVDSHSSRLAAVERRQQESQAIKAGGGALYKKLEDSKRSGGTVCTFLFISHLCKSTSATVGLK